MSHPKNQVLSDDYRSSENFYLSDQILQSHLRQNLDGEHLRYIQSNLELLGKQAAGAMDVLSMRADQNGPRLKKRSKLGDDIDEVTFHPAYGQLMDIAAQSEMFHLKYHPQKKERFVGARHRLGFALGQLYAMSELGQYCPHCMTDGAAYLVEQFANAEDRSRLLPKLGAKSGAELFTGAMFLTEKSGGSDVGANLSTAEQLDGKRYKLKGEKWFCSNVNADVILALARTGDIKEGTRGLSIFLVENQLF